MTCRRSAICAMRVCTATCRTNLCLPKSLRHWRSLSGPATVVDDERRRFDAGQFSVVESSRLRRRSSRESGVGCESCASGVRVSQPCASPASNMKQCGRSRGARRGASRVRLSGEHRRASPLAFGRPLARIPEHEAPYALRMARRVGDGRVAQASVDPGGRSDRARARRRRPLVSSRRLEGVLSVRAGRHARAARVPDDDGDVRASELASVASLPTRHSSSTAGRNMAAHEEQRAAPRPATRRRCQRHRTCARSGSCSIGHRGGIVPLRANWRGAGDAPPSSTAA